MRQSRDFFVLLVGSLSGLLVAASIYMYSQANKQLGRVLKVGSVPVEEREPQPPPSLDDKITAVQQKLRIAANGIRTKKGQIRSHASNAIRAIDARGEQSLDEAKNLMRDVAENSKIILKRNEEIETELLNLSRLYQQKIERILAAKKIQQESGLGFAFWTGLVGMVATISKIVLDWRKDKRELIELRHKIAAQQPS